nr:ATP-binding protein [Nocardioides luti]
MRPHPASVGEARRLVREELARAGRDDLVETAELLVSEVVTNALVHAGTQISVRAWVLAVGLRVEVGDGSTQLPAPRHNSTLAGTGRGLRMLQQMVDRWGAQPSGEGKTVWFELDRGDREGAESVLDLSGLPEVDVVPGPDTLAVELRNVPLLIHVAWHQHAEALLREYLLHNLTDDDDLLALQAHAAASEAIGLMLEHFPDPGLGDDSDELMATATEPAVSSPKLVLPVSGDDVTNFKVLDETIDAAIALSDAGAFLNPPTQPEIRAFRRWVCREVAIQAVGGRASAWMDLADAAPPEVAPLPWASREVSESPTGQIAADDANRILAVSPPALAALGYDHEDELVGQRLVAIIPPRYRQAHLAGFTLFLANGRAPLLDRAVTVPGLCRDGSERLVELTIAAHRLADGRHVFVADLRLPEAVPDAASA